MARLRILFRSEDPANAIYVVAQGIIGASSSLDFARQLGEPNALLCSPQPLRRPSDLDEDEVAFAEEAMHQCDQHGIGAILNDTAYFARRKCGAQAVAQVRCA